MVPRAVILAVALIAPALPAQDLKTAAAEPNPVKRARLAMANAEQAATKAAEPCRANDSESCNTLLQEVQDSVELADKSLEASGIDARRNPRHFKDAEIRTRKILRRVDPLRAYLQAEDLDRFRAVYRRISAVDDRLISAIMGKKKKERGAP